MPLAEWFRLWLFPPAAPTDARVTQAPPTAEGMTPMVTDADIPPDRRAVLLGVQEHQHRILNLITAAHGYRQIERRRQRHQEPAP